MEDIMATISEVTKEMDGLEEEAVRLLANPDLTAGDRRQRFGELLARYNALDAYKRALAAFVRRMLARPAGTPLDPEAVLREILGSPEFAVLSEAVMAMLVAVTYAGGPRAAWVPLPLLPVPVSMAPVPGLRR